MHRPEVKKETYTSRQPDGTIVTTTTKTETLRPSIYTDTFYEEDEYYGDYTWTTFNCDYCWTPSAILRIVEIIVCFIIVGCITSVFGTGPFVGVLAGHTFALILASLCMCITFTLLVVLFLGLHTTHLAVLPWRYIDAVYSVCAVVLFFIAAILEAYYSTGHWQNCSEQQHMKDRCPIYYPWIGAAVFCFVNALLYIISACLAITNKYFR